MFLGGLDVILGVLLASVGIVLGPDGVEGVAQFLSGRIKARAFEKQMLEKMRNTIYPFVLASRADFDENINEYRLRARNRNCQQG